MLLLSVLTMLPLYIFAQFARACKLSITAFRVIMPLTSVSVDVEQV